MSYRLLFCCLFVSCCFQLRAENVDKSGPPGSSFVFGDEFNAEVLDDSIWGLGINERNVQNTSVDCTYLKKNISFRNGLLVFTQRRENPPVTGKTWSDEELAKIVSKIPLNRIGDESDIANTVKFIVDSRYITRLVIGSPKISLKSICLNLLGIVRKLVFGVACGGMTFEKMKCPRH